MLEDFLDFVDQNELFTQEQSILLAVSGGVDSMVMAHLFGKANLNFSIAHCNFMLRDDASNEDEKFVAKQAKNINASFYSKRFETKKYATKNGMSTQLAARELRYQWFLQLLDDEGFDYVATAHHLNDSIETVLYNFAKGTGIAGLVGVPMKHDNIIRPMLFAKRKEIEKYAKEEQVAWREDVSNQSNDYSRNLIRNKVLPVLRKVNPAIEDTFRTTQLRLQATRDILNKEVEVFKSAHTEDRCPDLLIDKKNFAETNLVVADEILKPYGFNFAQVLDIRKAVVHEGKVFDTTDYRLNIDRDKIIVSPKELATADDGLIEKVQEAFANKFFSLKLSKELNTKPLELEGQGVKLDFESLQFPLTVRKWQDGDSFYPLGMKGKKKLSDFMIDNKIPLNLKERVYVLVSAGEIAWVIGHRLDDRFKVKPSTKQTLNFHLTYHD